MPAKPRPNAADTKNSPASSWVSRKRAIATAWQAEPAITVRRPPMRSASAPQAWRERKAQPSISDSIAAPCVGLMPMIAAEGDDMRRRDRHRNAAAEAGEADQRLRHVGMHAGDARPLAPARAGVAHRYRRGLGRRLQEHGRGQDDARARRRRRPASPPASRTCVMPRSKNEGHTTPATYWPEEISAIAAPRRRSNQRLT